MSISTKGITQGGGLPKLILPGNVEAKIVSIYLDRPAFFVKGEYNLVLFLETLPPAENFEGFFINKEKPELGRHDGQIGRVKAGEYAFSDGKTKGGRIIERDAEIMRFLYDLCEQLGVMEWFDAQDNKYNTIEEFVQAMDTEKPFENIVLNWCIAGKEYDGKNGYKNYDLYLPKWVKGKSNFESQQVDPGKSKLVTFDESIHLKAKKASAPLERFDGGEETNLSDSSFDLKG